MAGYLIPSGSFLNICGYTGKILKCVYFYRSKRTDSDTSGMEQILLHFFCI